MAGWCWTSGGRVLKTTARAFFFFFFYACKTSHLSREEGCRFSGREDAHIWHSWWLIHERRQVSNLNSTHVSSSPLCVCCRILQAFDAQPSDTGSLNAAWTGCKKKKKLCSKHEITQNHTLLHTNPGPPCSPLFEPANENRRSHSNEPPDGI